MKKKGFTLVELLAVIAILAILVIIALPNVLRMFRNAKENTFVTEVQEIIKTAEQGYISGSLSNKECKCFSNASNPLDLSGRNNIQYYVEFNDKGQVINLTVKDDTYQFVSEGEVIKIADIGSSTSGKEKTTSLALESTEVPSCDGSSEENKTTLKTYSATELCAPAEDTYGCFFTKYIGTTDVESIVFTNTKEVPEGVVGQEDVSDDNSGNIMMWWTDTDNNYRYEVTIGGEGGVKANPDSSYLFAYLTNLTSIDLTYLDTSEVTDMSYMFSADPYYENSIKTLDLSNLDTSKVTNMQGMFYRCSKLTSITYGNKFVINEDTNIKDMFYGTDNLTNEPYIKFNSIYADRFNGD